MLPVSRDLALSLDLDLFAYRAKIRVLIDEITGMRVERGTSFSLTYGLGLIFGHLWKP